MLAAAPLRGTSVRDGITTSGADAFPAYDHVADDGVNLAPGESLSLLLDSGGSVDAVGVLGSAAGGNVQVAVSDNYRDWRLVYAGPIDDSQMAVIDFQPVAARFVRVMPVGGTVRVAEVAAGTHDDVVAIASSLHPADWGDITQPDNIYVMLGTAYDWQIDHITDPIGWTSAAFYTGVMSLFEATGDTKYRDDMIDIAQAHDWKLKLRTSGKGLYHADDQCMGQTYLELYMESPSLRQESWIADTQSRLDTILANPHTGRQDYDWCDALFMAPPVWMRLYAITGDAAYLDFINGMWWSSTDYLYDTTEHLFYRDSSYFNDLEPNGEHVFWSRGNGWVVGGIVRVLQYMPADYTDRPRWVQLLRDMCTRIASVQQPDGLWTTSLLYPAKYDGEPETSGSAFFVYAMAWGINEGILDRATFGPVAEKGWAGLAKLEYSDGRIAYIQQVGAGPAKNDGIFTGRDYGYGAFLLAGVQMARYYHTPIAASAAAQAPAAMYVDPAGNPADWQVLGNAETGDTSGWTATNSASGGTAVAVADPFQPSANSAYRLRVGSTSGNHIFFHHALPTQPSSGTFTLYVRFATDGPDMDAVWGLSDVAAPSGYNDYEAMVRVFGLPLLQARDSGSYVGLFDDYFEQKTWQELWLVVDMGADTYDAYLAGGDQRRGIQKIAAGMGFRNGASSSAMRTFCATLNYGNGDSDLYLDDVYYSTGQNLSRPPAAGVEAISVFSDDLIHHPTDWRYTPVGWIYDAGTYPWIYSDGEAGWWWIDTPVALQAGDGSTGFAGWSAGASDGWFWTDRAWAGWLYDYDADTWRVVK